MTNHAHYVHGGQNASITQVNAVPGGGNLVTGYTYTLSPGSGRITTTTLPDGTMQQQKSNFLGLNCKIVRPFINAKICKHV